MKIKHIEEAIALLDINTKKKNVSALKQLGKWYLRDGFPHLSIETQKIILGKGKARIPKAKSEDEFREIKEHAKRLLGEGKREGIWILLRPSIVFLRKTDHLSLYINKIREMCHF